MTVQNRSPAQQCRTGLFETLNQVFLFCCCCSFVFRSIAEVPNLSKLWLLGTINYARQHDCPHLPFTTSTPTWLSPSSIHRFHTNMIVPSFHSPLPHQHDCPQALPLPHQHDCPQLPFTTSTPTWLSSSFHSPTPTWSFTTSTPTWLSPASIHHFHTNMIVLQLPFTTSTNTNSLDECPQPPFTTSTPLPFTTSTRTWLSKTYKINLHVGKDLGKISGKKAWLVFHLPKWNHFHTNVIAPQIPFTTSKVGRHQQLLNKVFNDQ